jgi:TolB protein
MPGVTPDGAWVVYMASDPAGKRSLFRVSTAGGTPQRLGDPPSAAFWGNFVYSPDGRQILAVNNGSRKHDLWVLENFEPAVKK